MNDKLPKSARNCPALSRTITPKECGSDRVSKIDCPDTCEFHPFTLANAGGLTSIEERLLKKVQKRVLDELRGDQARELGRKLRESEDEVEHFLMLLQAVHTTGEVEGPDFVDRWAKDHFEGLNNDERTLLKAQQTQRPVLIQIKRVIDEQSMEVLDLLGADPQPFTVVADVELDEAMEGDTLLGWVYDAPLFTRLSGPAFELPEHESGQPLEALREIAKTLDGPLLPDQLRLWLKTHALEIYQMLEDVEDTDDEEEFGAGVEDVYASFDWADLPDFSQDQMPRQRPLGEREIDDRLGPFLHRHKDPEQAVQWFEETWQDIASSVDQVTDGVLSDEGFGVVLILLAKAACVLHPRAPVREDPSPVRFMWQLGREMSESIRIITDESGEEAFEQYIQDSPQPVVCQWLCGEAASFAEGNEAVFDNENLSVVFPIIKAAVWEMCHWPAA